MEVTFQPGDPIQALLNDLDERTQGDPHEAVGGLHGKRGFTCSQSFSQLLQGE
jgi:hypothetical protein